MSNVTELKITLKVHESYKLVTVRQLSQLDWLAADYEVIKMLQSKYLVYSSNNEGTWYRLSPDDIDLFVEEHLVNGNKVEHLVNEEIKVNLKS